MRDEWITTKLCSHGGFSQISRITVDTKNNDLYFTTSEEHLWKIRSNCVDQEPEEAATVKRGWLSGVVWNGDNIIYICDSTHDQILWYSIQNGKLGVLAGCGSRGYLDGNAKEAMFCFPWGITMDKNGDLLIAETSCVRKILLPQRVVHTIAGGTDSLALHRDGNLSDARFFQLSAIATDNNNVIYVCDRKNHCIRQIKNGMVSTLVGIPQKIGNTDGPFTEATFKFPTSIALDSYGNILVSDENYRLRRIYVKDQCVSKLAVDNKMLLPSEMAYDGNGFLYVALSWGIFRLENLWKWRRYLWIGSLKEDASYCCLATLPRDVVREIAQYIVGQYIE